MAELVELVPMTSSEFIPYLEELIPEYAAEHVRTGRFDPGVAETEARGEVGKLLPKGVDTPDQHLFIIVAKSTGTRVGVIWLFLDSSRRPPQGFIYDLRIFPPYRRAGYGGAAMRSIESFARSRGAGQIGLHVFGHNSTAIHLYERLGYLTTNRIMAKTFAEVAERSDGD
jgi:ribosomal protein S18 acetylase RimI-like enzyme